MRKYFQSKKQLMKTIDDLKKKINDVDNEVTRREREKYFAENMELISEYEGKIRTEAEKAADDRELSMLDIIQKKEDRIKELEIEIIDQRAAQRTFKNDVKEHELLMHEFNIDMQSTTSTMNKLTGKFESMEYKMSRLSKRIDRKEAKLLEKEKPSTVPD